MALRRGSPAGVVPTFVGVLVLLSAYNGRAAWVYHKHAVPEELALGVHVDRGAEGGRAGALPPAASGNLVVGQRCPEKGEGAGPHRALVKFPLESLASLDVASADVRVALRRFDYAGNAVVAHRLAADFDGTASHATLPPRTDEGALATADVSEAPRGAWGDVVLNVTASLVHAVERGYGTFLVDISGDEQRCYTRAIIKPSMSLVITHQTDETPPEARLTSSPPSPSPSTEAALAFEGRDDESGVSHFECALDDADFLPCTSPWRYENLQDGSHTFAVRAIDRAGNVGEAAYTTPWVVDTSAPSVALTDAPPPRSDVASASFVFSFQDPSPSNGGAASGVAAVRCQLDGGALSRCTSPMTYTGLAEGSHTFAVRVTDHANNSAVSDVHTWTVDLPPAVALELVAEQPDAASGNARGIGRNAAAARASKRRGSSGRDARVMRGAFTVRVAWSERVDGFDETDVQLNGVDAEVVSMLLDSKAAAHGEVYLLTLRPLASGQLTMGVPAEAVRDANGRTNPLAAPPLTVHCDLTAPTVSMVGVPPFADDAFRVSFAWSEPVFDFDPKKHVKFEGVPVSIEVVALKNAGAAAAAASNFAVRIVPQGVGTLSISIPADVATDMAGNTNAAVESAGVQLVSGTSVLLGGDDAIQSRRFAANLDEQGHAKQLPFGLGRAALAGAAVDRQGRLVVADAANACIHFLDEELGGNATIHGFSGVSAVAVDDTHGVLYVAYDAGVWAVNATTGEALMRLDLSGEEAGTAEAATMTLSRVVDLAYDGASTVYAVDADRAALFALATDAGAADAVRRIAGGASSLNQPAAVEVDGDGFVYVADAGAIHVLARNGSSVAAISEPAAFKGRFRPSGLAVDRHARLWVGNAANGGALLFRKPEARAPATAYLTSLGGDAKAVSGVVVAMFRDRTPPLATIELLDNSETQAGELPKVHGEFDVVVTWSKPVLGFEAEAMLVEGAGGRAVEILGLDSWNEENGAESGDTAASAEYGLRFKVRVAPASVGVITVGIRSGAVLDGDGNANGPMEADAKLNVVFYGGECSVSLGCQWQLTEYEHQLAAERVELEANARLRLERERLALQHAADARRDAQRHAAEERLEAMRHESALAQAQVERETLAEKARLESDARVAEARATQGLELEKIAAHGSAMRDTVLASIGRVLGMLGEATGSLLDDVGKLQRAAGLIAALFFGFFAARELASALAEVVRRLFGQPRLVRASSRYSLAGLLIPGFVRRMLVSSKPPAPVVRDAEPDIVLNANVKDKVNTIGFAVHACHTRGTPLRNVLFFGAPGTGKTLVAERLARTVGLDYALMSGGDVAPLGEKAVTELHRVFDWASKSARGVLVFVDEADAFLKRRKGGEHGEDGGRAAVNAFLARTSAQSERVMLVLATNRPSDLDEAVMDRVDAAIEFPVPQQAERVQLLRLGLAKEMGALTFEGDRIVRLVPPRARFGRQQRPVVEGAGGLGLSHIEHTAKRLDGWSGRGLAKFASALALRVYGRDVDGKATLSPNDLDEIVQEKLQEARGLKLFEARGNVEAMKANGFGGSNGNVAPNNRASPARLRPS